MDGILPVNIHILSSFYKTPQAQQDSDDLDKFRLTFSGVYDQIISGQSFDLSSFLKVSIIRCYVCKFMHLYMLSE